MASLGKSLYSLLRRVSGHFLPKFGSQYDIGSAELPFRDGYFSGTIHGGGGGSDHEVLVSVADTTSGFLSSKITAGANITLAITNPGANETLEISGDVSTGYQGVWQFGTPYNQGDIVTTASDSLLYGCILTYGGSSDYPGNDPTHWVRIASLSYVGNYADLNGFLIRVGQYVTFGGERYWAAVQTFTIDTGTTPNPINDPDNWIPLTIAEDEILFEPVGSSLDVDFRETGFFDLTITKDLTISCTTFRAAHFTTFLFSNTDVAAHTISWSGNIIADPIIVPALTNERIAITFVSTDDGARNWVEVSSLRNRAYASGTFISADAKTITVVNGIITSIV